MGNHMKLLSKTVLLIAVLLGLSNNAAQAEPLDRSVGNEQAITTTGFEENKGQVRTTTGDAALFVRYRLIQGSTSIFLLENGIAYQFKRTHYPAGYAELKAAAELEATDEKEFADMRKNIRTETFRMDMILEGADPHPRVSTEGRIAGYVNDYRHGVLDVHSYERVTYHDVYPGIDWVVYTTTDGIKYDFIVQPGADASVIALRFKDHEELFVDQRGALVHGNRLGQFTEEPPVSFQGGKSIATRFALDGELLRFEIDAHDKSQPLTIDPPRFWGTYYGGDGDDEGYGCATDGDGNVYLAGMTRSTGAIAEGGVQNTYGGDDDAFLVKFNAAGSRLWATYYGGDSLDLARACAVDGNGNVYLAGITRSPSGIATSDGHQITFEGGYDGDAFLVKFDPDGSRIWATYYGGSDGDRAYSCAVDGNDNVFMAGVTASPNGIASNGHQNTKGAQFDTFLVKFDPNGTRLWGTYFGSNGNEFGRSCFAAPDGSVLLTGDTYSTTEMATPGAHQTTIAPFGDAFLAKFEANGVRSWSTYYGGSGNDFGMGVVTDEVGNIYLTGSTFSPNGIAANGFQNTRAGFMDAYLVKFSAAGTRIWGTYYGGSSNSSQQAYACAIDGDGNVYIAGNTTSTVGMGSGGYQNTYGGSPNNDAFLAKFNESGARIWGTYYGAIGEDVAKICATDSDGNVFIAGFTSSTTVIASSDGHSTTLGDGTDAFLAKLNGSDGMAISEVLQQDLLRLLPNPNHGDHWYIDLSAIPGARGYIPMEVLDQTGKRVASSTLQLSGANTTEVTLDVDLPSGVYFLRVWVDGRAYTVRSVVQR